MKEDLLVDLVSVLKKVRFKIIDCSRIHSCFDVFAKRKEVILLIKVLANIEALSSRTSEELKKVSALVSGTPLVVGDHMKSKKLERGVLYSRYGINVLNLGTLKGILKGKEAPKIYSIRGNYCVKIDPEALVNLRKKLDLTQKKLAQKLEVSKQSVYRYERNGKISLEIAQKIEKKFGEDVLSRRKLIKKVFSSPSEFKLQGKGKLTRLQKLVILDLERIGFKTSPTHAPFNLVAIKSGQEKIFTVVSNASKGLEKKTQLIQKISDLLQRPKACISEKGQNLDILVVSPEELEKLSRAQELIDLLSE